MRLAALVVGLLLAVAFAVQNTAVVGVSLLFWDVRASLAIVMALCLVFGLVLGVLALAPGLFAGRRTARRLARQLAELSAGEPSGSPTVRHPPTHESPIGGATPKSSR